MIVGDNNNNSSLACPSFHSYIWCLCFLLLLWVTGFFPFLFFLVAQFGRTFWRLPKIIQLHFVQGLEVVADLIYLFFFHFEELNGVLVFGIPFFELDCLLPQVVKFVAIKILILFIPQFSYNLFFVFWHLCCSPSNFLHFI